MLACGVLARPSVSACIRRLSPRPSGQVMVDFTGSPSSQEINGTFDAVSCDLVFSSASASTLGIGHTCQFVSSSSLKVPEHDFGSLD